MTFPVKLYHPDLKGKLKADGTEKFLTARDADELARLQSLGWQPREG
jgi:hypothetical protein